MVYINKLPLGYFTMDFAEFEYYLQSLDSRCNLPMPDYHIELCNYVQDMMDSGEKRIQILAPRRTGKTQIMAHHLGLYRLMRDPTECILMYSADSDLALQNSSTIQRLIQTVPICRKRLLPDNKARQDWTKGAFRVKGSNMMRNEPSIYASGILSTIVGQHPDWIFCDDIEIDKNVTNEDRRKGVREKVNQAIPAVADQMLIWGTYWTQDSVYLYTQERLKFKSRTWQIYWPFITGEETEDEIEGYLWPERFGWEGIQEARLGDEDGKGSAWFKSQYGLIPTAAWESKFQIENIKFFSGDLELVMPMNSYEGKPKIMFGDEKVYQCVAAWDTAEGKKGGNKSILSIGFRTKTGYFWYKRIILPPTNPDDGFDRQAAVVVQSCMKYFVQELHIEKNYTKHLRSVCIRIAKEMNTKLPPDKKLTLPEIIEYPAKGDKFVRIANTLAPIIDFSIFYVHEDILEIDEDMRPKGEVWNEMLEFPFNQESPDSLDTAQKMIEELMDIPELLDDLRENISPRRFNYAQEYVVTDDGDIDSRDMEFDYDD